MDKQYAYLDTETRNFFVVEHGSLECAAISDPEPQRTAERINGINGNSLGDVLAAAKCIQSSNWSLFEMMKGMVNAKSAKGLESDLLSNTQAPPLYYLEDPLFPSDKTEIGNKFSVIIATHGDKSGRQAWSFKSADELNEEEGHTLEVVSAAEGCLSRGSWEEFNTLVELNQTMTSLYQEALLTQRESTSPGLSL